VPTYFRLHGSVVRAYGAPIEPKPREKYEQLFDSRKIRYFDKRLVAQQRYWTLPNAKLGKHRIAGELSVMLADDRLGRLHLVKAYPFHFEVEFAPAIKKAEANSTDRTTRDAPATSETVVQPKAAIQWTPASETPVAPTVPLRTSAPPTPMGYAVGAGFGILALLVGPRGPLAGGAPWSRLAAWPRTAGVLTAATSASLGFLAGFGTLANATAVCVVAVVLGLLAALPSAGGTRRRVSPLLAALGAASLAAAAVLWLAITGFAAWDFGVGYAGMFLFRALFGARGAEPAPSYVYSWEAEYAETLKRRRSQGRAA
jgi:hypothetical protein